MTGHARAPAAGTVLNALANGYGCAFAIDEYVRAAVDIDSSGKVHGEVAGAPNADTALVEACAAAIVGEHGNGEGAHVRTESDVPMASGLKSSSAAANATLLATADALGVELDRERAVHLGVEAAREVGVTVTGALDDASASMLGGVSLTNNREDEILDREVVEWDVLVHVPDEKVYSADADISRCERVAPVADLVRGLAADGRYATAMTVNGFAFCAALGFSPEPVVEALPAADGASLSGTGPSYVAVGNRSALKDILTAWDAREGTTWLTTTQTEGATTWRG